MRSVCAFTFSVEKNRKKKRINFKKRRIKNFNYKEKYWFQFNFFHIEFFFHFDDIVT